VPAYLPDMLALSPPFPLIIDHVRSSHDVTAEDEGIMLALQHRDRLCRLFLRMPVLILQKVIPTIDDEFPILDYLIVRPLGKHNSHLILPSTFRAPHQRHLVGSLFLSNRVASTYNCHRSRLYLSSMDLPIHISPP
jgi:hypothetical protein